MKFGAAREGGVRLSLTFRDVLRTGFFGAVLFLLIAHTLHPTDGWLLVLSRVSEHLGIALLVTVVVGSSFDVYLKDRFAKEVATDLSALVIAYRLHPLLRDEVDALCRLTLYRKDLRISLAITEQPDDPGLVRVVVRLWYTLVNPTDLPQPFVHRVILEALPVGVPAPRLLSAGGRRVHLKGSALEDYDLNDDDVSLVARERALTWEKEVRLPKGSDGPSASFWSEVEEYHLVHDSATIFTREPVVGLSLEVHHPPSLDVDVVFGHRRGDEARRTPLANASLWELDAGLLPMAGVAVYWRPKPVEVIVEQPVGVPDGVDATPF